jgi:nicotinate phosphoribosyltransferase
VRIFASGNLDEYEIERLLAAGAPVDGFGVGTKLVTSDDAPFLECAYKLEQYAGTPRRKRSTGKATWPGAKQVFRRLDRDGRLAGDTLGLEGEALPGAPLLVPVMRQGQRLGQREGLEAIRERCKAGLASLPEALGGLGTAEPFLPVVSEGVRRLAAEADARAG